MKNLNDLPPGRKWSKFFAESEHWASVEMPVKRYERDRDEIYAWLGEASFPGYFGFGMHPDWDDYMTVAFEDKDAAFAFKMRFGGL